MDSGSVLPFIPSAGRSSNEPSSGKVPSARTRRGPQPQSCLECRKAKLKFVAERYFVAKRDLKALRHLDAIAQVHVLAASNGASPIAAPERQIPMQGAMQPAFSCGYPPMHKSAWFDSILLDPLRRALYANCRSVTVGWNVTLGNSN